MMRADLDQPTYASPEWERRHGALALEQVGQVGVAHERTQPAAMLRWTSETPTTEGWFWTREDGRSAVPVYVFRRGMRLYALDSSGKFDCDVRGLWRLEWSDIAIPEPVE